jgi:hypothetical protein
MNSINTEHTKYFSYFSSGKSIKFSEMVSLTALKIQERENRSIFNAYESEILLNTKK